ncbi:hypothetical protein QQF64_017013 [Cirrhinus molitorella]|uniref:Uncharacterized protein n=1 Tax=Cirrhinus molitorella TaxID=172907 RepID=A0ABR3LSP1_9TELE
MSQADFLWVSCGGGVTSFASDQERFHPSGPALRERRISSDRRLSSGSYVRPSVNKRRQTSRNSSRFPALFRYLGLRGEAYVNTSAIPEIPKPALIRNSSQTQTLMGALCKSRPLSA